MMRHMTLKTRTEFASFAWTEDDSSKMLTMCFSCLVLDKLIKFTKNRFEFMVKIPLSSPVRYGMFEFDPVFLAFYNGNV